jgi:DNA-binding transcriptional MocR family regulator
MMELDWSRQLSSWSSGTGALSSRLAASLREMIERGDIAAGGRLPAERLLASALGVSRTTVVAAYSQLRSLGWIESRQGSGSWVRRLEASATLSMNERDFGAAFRPNVIFRGLMDDPGGTLEFLGAHLAAPRALEEEAPLGFPGLRRAVAVYLSDAGLPTREDQILITNGAQQAIALSVSLFVDRGDCVLMENPTYLGAIDTMLAAGARILTLPMGEEGVDLSRLRQALGSSPRLVYLMPTFHNPTGVVMPAKARQEVARLSEEHQIPMIEDLALADLSLSVEPPPPIAAFSRRAPILTVGSMSKLFWGGLRSGWIRGPAEIVQRIALFKAVTDLGGPLISQALSARLLSRAHEIRRLRRREIRSRFESLAALLRRHLPTWSFKPLQGGLLLWIRLPLGTGDGFAQTALRHGVSIVPGSANSPNGSYSEYIRLPLVREGRMLEEGVRRLARAWRDYEKKRTRAVARIGVID